MSARSVRATQRAHERKRKRGKAHVVRAKAKESLSHGKETPAPPPPITRPATHPGEVITAPLENSCEARPELVEPFLKVGSPETGFRNFQTIAEALDWFFRTGHEDIARTLGNDLYERSRALPNFDKVERAWLAAYRQHTCGSRTKLLSETWWHSSQGPNDMEPTPFKRASTNEQFYELFLLLLRMQNREYVLQRFRGIVTLAASEGNVAFFRKLAKSLTYRPKAPKRQSLAHLILDYWLSGLLWLMTHDRAAAALQHYTGREISGESLERECRRLKLLRYRDVDLPRLIEAYQPKTPAKYGLTPAGAEKFGTTGA
jgi:hypothetical protein